MTLEPDTRDDLKLEIANQPRGQTGAVVPGRKNRRFRDEIGIISYFRSPRLF